MSKSDVSEAGFLDLFFLNTAFTGVGDAGGLLPSAVAGSLYVSIHTSDPGEAGDQTTNEATYTGYARVAVPRSGAGWVRAGSTVDNVAAVVFPIATAGSDVATHFGIGTAATLAGKLCYSGALTASLEISAGITPSFAIGECNTTED